jgi:N-acetyl-anhydromuramyl-L-alanine amidase AmpD
MPVVRYPKAIWMGQTKNNSGQFAKDQPEIIVYHYTAAGSGAGSAKYLFGPHSPSSSAHFLIDRDGTVYQLSEINVKTWHAGVSSWGNRTGINSYGIGIEIANYGYWRKELSKLIPDPVKAGWLKLTHKNEHSPRYWEPYTDAQYRELDALTTWLAVILPTLHLQLGHDDISPGRKADPGPAFDIGRMRKVFANARKKPEDTSVATYMLLGEQVERPAVLSMMGQSDEPANTSDNPNIVPDTQDDLSIDTKRSHEVQVECIPFWKSVTFWGVVISILCKFAWAVFKWRPESVGLSTADMADLAKELTIGASFIGDYVALHGRKTAVTDSIARRITMSGKENCDVPPNSVG